MQRPCVPPPDEPAAEDSHGHCLSSEAGFPYEAGDASGMQSAAAGSPGAAAAHSNDGVAPDEGQPPPQAAGPLHCEPSTEEQGPVAQVRPLPALLS